MKLLSKILLALLAFIGLTAIQANADYYSIPDYDWTITTVTVNATPKTITFTRSAGIFIQAVGNDVYINKDATATTNKLKIANGASIDLQAQMVRKAGYISIVAGSSTIATVNYIIKQ